MSDQLSARPTATARVVFDTFRSPTDPMLVAWLSFRARVLPNVAPLAPPTQRPADGPLKDGVFGVWRLLATNNRELGRGSVLHPSPDRAWADAEALSGRAGELTAMVMRGTLSMRHGWALRLVDEPVLICSRWYESPGEAAAAARAARDNLARASIVRSVNIGTRSGRRHRQARESIDVHE
ncbi:hypothetical protein M3D75_02265 [Microbacterium enclense]|uniref:hypothetical protein n=1 Tax=Microbacterium enclense TaxID=993073 RepID=UPI0021A7F1B5|nr:hypothetical protein [Microbacterium enclense]MCT2084934.1 hypothetical protein [Microbacterium enclense]